MEAAHTGARRRAEQRNKRKRQARSRAKATADPLAYTPQPRLAKYSKEEALDVAVNLEKLTVKTVLHVSKPAFIGEALSRGLAKVWPLVQLATVLKFQDPLKWDGV
jgi:hypothetical protein